ncbi:MAG TPA: hypothetical protein VGG27_06690 [Magnetospirillaceae bacterium]|jgi:hypothetical protein
MATAVGAVQIIRDAYRLVWQHRGVLARLAWPIIIPLVAIAIVGVVLKPHGTSLSPPPKAFTPIFLVLMFVWFAMSIPITTSAYRLFMQGSTARRGLRYAGEEWLYVGATLRLIGRSFLVLLPILIVTIGVITLLSVGMGAMTRLFDLPAWPIKFFMFVAVGGIWLLMFYVLTRYTLVLPAAAIGQRIKLSQSAKAMDRNIGKLFVSYLATGVPVLAVLWVISAVTALPGMPHPISIVLGVLSVGIQLMGMFLPIAALSILYRVLSDQPADLAGAG